MLNPTNADIFFQKSVIQTLDLPDSRVFGMNLDAWELHPIPSQVTNGGLACPELFSLALSTEMPLFSAPSPAPAYLIVWLYFILNKATAASVQAQPQTF